jgi:DNA-binding NarL/FixJ family response regulator
VRGPGEQVIAEGVLNDRESLVWPWLGEAKTNEEIGMIVGMKTATVKKHVHRILEKLGVENRTAAALKGNGGTTAVSFA